MTIKANLDQVRSRITAASIRAGRDPSSVKLVAVSKKKSLELIQEAFAAGQRIFGENYVQEALEKKVIVPAAEFHLIGPLQSNKVKKVVGNFSLIHSVHKLDLAHEISKAAASRGITQAILLQVNVAGDENKSGLDQAEVFAVVEQVVKLKNIKLLGLMTIGREGAEREERRAEFRRLRDLRVAIEQQNSITLPELSMGMSDDFEIAIEQGATIVRVGSLIFGSRV
ncbi:YggS family pyridoxal phosphate-dependent enzyme [bacterium]|nr:YggS family pyridoxal phosphate-dependent enzyme [bacterium]